MASTVRVRGWPRVDDRAGLEGVLFVTENGIAWKRLPTELGFGSGTTARIAGIGVDSSQRPGRYRSVVERTFA